MIEGEVISSLLLTTSAVYNVDFQKQLGVGNLSLYHILKFHFEFDCLLFKSFVLEPKKGWHKTFALHCKSRCLKYVLKFQMSFFKQSILYLYHLWLHFFFQAWSLKGKEIKVLFCFLMWIFYGPGIAAGSSKGPVVSLVIDRLCHNRKLPIIHASIYPVPMPTPIF